MRLIRMNRRSRYWGKSCMHCHKPVTEDRVAFASTYYVMPYPNVADGTLVSTYKRKPSFSHREEHEVRIVYHRRCIEGILQRGPLDAEEEQSMFEEYRERLLEVYEPKGPRRDL